MRIGLSFLLATLLGSPLLSLAADTNAPAVFKDDREKVGYAIGLYFANQLTNAIKRNNFDVDPDVVMTAMKDVLAGKPAKMNDQDAQGAIRSYQLKRQQEVVEKNTKAGEDFLAANRKKAGVRTHPVTMPDGTTAELQYKVLSEGSGALPGSNEVAKVNYRGTLINGTEFDSSAKHGGQPLTFALNGNGVIRGMIEAVKLMKIGSKWEIYIPTTLAYRDRPMGPIEPGSALIFEVELLSAEAQQPPPPPPAAQPLTSDIIRVPSAEEMKAGQQVERIDPKKLEELQRQAAGQTKTNKP